PLPAGRRPPGPRAAGAMLRGLVQCTVAAALLAADVLAAQQPSDLALDSLLATPISASAKYQQTSTETASAVTVVTRDQIERFGYRTLADMLAGVSGFYLSNDRNYIYLGARGFSRPTDYNNRILLLVNGHQMNEGIWGAAAVDLPVLPEAVERIEIVRGPGSALYGTGAVFGVVNIVTRTGESIAGGEAELRGGSHGERGGAVMYGHRTTKGLDLSLSALWDGVDGTDRYYREYDAPETSRGVAHALDWEHRWQLHGHAGAGAFAVEGWLSRRSKGIPTGAYGTIFDAPSRTEDSYGFVEARYERALDRTKSVRVRGFYDRYRYEGVYVYPEELNEEWGSGDVVGSEVTARWDLASAHRLTLGAEYRHNLRAEYGFVPATSELHGFDDPWSSASLFAEHEFQAARGLTFLAGARLDDQSTSRATLVPRAAVLMDPWRGTTLKLLFGGAFRAPNRYEAIAQTETYRVNPALHEERAHTLEAVWQQRLGRGLFGTVSGFAYRAHGLIDLTVDSTDGLYVYRNVGRSEATGAEVGLEARFTGLTGYANYTYQHALDGSTDLVLTNSPAHLLKAGVAADLARSLGAALEARYESSRVTVYGTRTDAFGIANLNVWLSPLRRSTREDGRLLVSVRVSNLFDVDYANPGGVEHVQAAIAQDGRAVSAELRYRF
ncbi:MAG TPA: TonB-dependent receptor, partial [Gemmatimonadales bacterium]|nr:TonB-dependent receptor [Gemmatimonadales bacterium]